jgi:hypothetical protein
VRPGQRELARRLRAGLRSFDRTEQRLPGIRDRERRDVLIQQFLDSVHRVQFVAVLRTRRLSDLRADPNNEMFDPVRSAIVLQRRGNIEEAFWMVFLFVHFGRHARAHWRYAREIYGRQGAGPRWDWARTSADPNGFREWLRAYQENLSRDNTPHGFGNHRKYESLDAHSPHGTGAVVESYIRWIGPPRTHQQIVEEALLQARGDPSTAFDLLYQSMKAVSRFGRTARFDYLAMVGKLGLALIEPGSPYVAGSTGPLKGAILLFGRRARPANLDAWLVTLGERLEVGMQVIEDALCNWQKSPDRFQRFRG